MSEFTQREYKLIAKGWCANIYRVLNTDMVCKSSASSCIEAFQAEKVAYDRFEEAYEAPWMWSTEPSDVEMTQDNLSIVAKPRRGCLPVSKSWKINILAYYGVDLTAPNADLDAPLRPLKANRDPSTLLPSTPSAILLAYMPHNCLGHFLWAARHFNHNNPLLQPTSELFLRWARQAAEGIAYAHACGVLHGDIFQSNFLLDANMNLRIGDWGGACIRYDDGDKEKWTRCRSLYRLTHCWFGYDEAGMEVQVDHDSVSVRSEVFALGSALYSMVNGSDLWYGELEYKKDRAEIVRRIRKMEMPGTEGMVLGEVMKSCWVGDYRDMLDVVSYDDTIPSLTLPTGEVHEANVVVAVDGIKSLARELIFGFEDKPKSSGYACFRAFFKGASQATESGAVLDVCLKLAGKGQVPLATRVFEKLRFDRVRSSQLNCEDLRDRWHNALRAVEAGGIIDPESIKLRNGWLYPFDAEADTVARWQAVSSVVRKELEDRNITPLFETGAQPVLIHRVSQ
ncbi:hypothetical protein LTR96_011178 [Exophiala xenobiotica]|nr:hypothetical protein LTR96_011178 [Exophiala xenobiotica]KAK5284807.1 hypothetical protein LTR14_011481 [Exophiala xenobiotica]KAK5332911.1 hypothetical protein LTR98_010961 [Exophiala xenobiotica]KAK5468989.1 hypothetical protein LTR55_011483 [Exophiala xenobiotica]